MKSSKIIFNHFKKPTKVATYITPPFQRVRIALIENYGNIKYIAIWLPLIKVLHS